MTRAPKRSPAVSRLFVALASATAFVCGASRASADDAHPPAAAPPPPNDGFVEPTGPARPPLPEHPPPPPLPWSAHVEFGPDLAFLTQPATHDEKGRASGVRYGFNVGWGLHASWNVIRYLRFSAYLLDSNHAVNLPPGALGLPGQIQSDSVHTYVFGAKLAPTLPLGEHMRLWALAGVGWGRWDFPRMTVHDPSGATYLIYERANSMAQFPLGIGASYDVIPRWMSITLEVSGALIAGQGGTAVDSIQTVDYRGFNLDVGGLPRLDASIVQTIGVSILL